MQWATGLQFYYVIADPKVAEQHTENNRVSAVLSKILNIYSFNNLTKIKKIAITHLSITTAFWSTYHLVDTEKVAEYNIF